MNEMGVGQKWGGAGGQLVIVSISQLVIGRLMRVHLGFCFN